mgnify:CR=1 FL=1
MNKRKFKKAVIETIKEMFVVFVFTIVGCIIAIFSDAIAGTIAYGLAFMFIIVFAANMYLEYKDLKYKDE